MTPTDPAPSLAILPGRADDMRAELVVRVTLGGIDGDGGALRLVGTLVGPRRGRDMTLPTSVRLVEAAGDHAAVARAVFTEPAYWTPELPNLYRLHADVNRGERTVAVIDRMIGLRRLGVRGRSFWLEGRRWVLRGVSVARADFDPASLRSLPAAAVVDDPTAELCVAADQAGVAIVARLADADGRGLDGVRAAERFAAWALHPSVVLAVVPRTLNLEEAGRIVMTPRSIRGTMLVGLEVDGTQPPDAVPAAVVEAADCLVVALPCQGVPHESWRSWGLGKPLVAQRAVASGTAAEQRRECDRLQATLAAWGLAAGVDRLPWDWAGYLASPW